jgi:tRNA pseudouridine38-40 synthase
MASSNSYAHKLILAYDGTDLYGWQRTQEGLSVQESLEKALATLLQEEVTTEAASRTDRGVHALAQVVAFTTSKEITYYSFLKGLNALLPPTIRVLSIESVPLTFHPTLDALTKEYSYHMCNSRLQLPTKRFYSWHVPYALDVDKMREAAHRLQGEHDFAAFTNLRKNEIYDSTIRRLDLFEISDTLEMRLVGPSFLYKMVRNLVGTVVYVGRGKIALEELPQILHNKDRRQAGIAAPAHGLRLKKIHYAQ